MASEGEFPKTDGDILYASEVNSFNNFGDGSYGEMSIGSNITLTLTQGSIYQVTSLTLNEYGIINCTGHSKYPLYLLCQGDATINGSIILKGVGLSGGGAGANGEGYVEVYSDNDFTLGVGARSNASRRGISNPFCNFAQKVRTTIINGGGGAGGYQTTGDGGGGGFSPQRNGEGGGGAGAGGEVGGAGGNGGCTLFLNVGGSLIFGANSFISTNGDRGSDATGGNSGGGGGGGAGDIIIFHYGPKVDDGLNTAYAGGSGGLKAGAGTYGGTGASGTLLIDKYQTIFW